MGATRASSSRSSFSGIPAVDVILNRLPAAFVPVGRKGGEELIDAISSLARSMDNDDAFVIFPEGANYTDGRRARAIQKLREIGRPDLAERAEDLKQTLPPRSLGVITALGRGAAGLRCVLRRARRSGGVHHRR